MLIPIPLDSNTLLPASVFPARDANRTVIIIALNKLTGCQKGISNCKIAIKNNVLLLAKGHSKCPTNATTHTTRSPGPNIFNVYAFV